MSAPSVTMLVERLRDSRLLDPAQVKELDSLQQQFPDIKALAKELVQRSWLTVYQINQVLQNKTKDLFLDPYIVLERLGEGGMGQVFKAKHRGLGRIAALKVIRKERIANADAVRRFQREVRAAAQLSHPNVVLAYDADEANGTHFIAMEYVDGVDLAKLVKDQGPLPATKACEYMRQAALGLQHAHEQGLVHRDIKPANLLVTRSAERGARNENPPSSHSALRAPRSELVKILDMGLARLTDDSGEKSSTTLTQEGSVMGTLDYIAPEQAMDAHTADIRADLYSLGCTFYFLLTGRVPFPGGSAMEKLLKHRLEQPTPIEELRPDVPPAVSAVISKLMAKDASDRYQTPAELAGELEYLTKQVDLSSRTVSIGPKQNISESAPTASISETPREGFTDLASLGAGALHRAAVGERPRRPKRPPRLVQTGLRLWQERPKLVLGVGGGALGFLLLVLLLIVVNPFGGSKEENPPPVASKPDLSKPDGKIEPAKVEEPPKQITNSIGMKLAHIPAGKFLMGASPAEIEEWQRKADNPYMKRDLPHEGPQHGVRITRPFYLGVNEVTVGQFRAFVEETGYRTDVERAGSGAWRLQPNGGWAPDPNCNWQNPGWEQTDDHPVTCVTRNDAKAFCGWLSKKEGKTCRLPTEAEWEYACRAGTGTPFASGSDLTSDQANVGNKLGKTVRVGSYSPNGFGLHDMHGNIWEWCEDWYAHDYYRRSPEVDPPGPVESKVAPTPGMKAYVNRGGGWYQSAFAARSNSRGYTDRCVTDHGFRVVMVPATESAPIQAPEPALVNLSELNTDAYNWFPWLSEDALTIYWTSLGADRVYSIWSARRKDANSPFENKTRLLGGRMQALTGDQLELVVVKPRPYGQPGESLHVARRTSVDQPFGPPVEIKELVPRTPTEETEMPCLSPDGLTLHFSRVDAGKAEFHVTTRKSRDVAWAASKPLAMVLDTVPERRLSWPFVTADGQTLFCANEGASGQGRFMKWTRPTLDAPFANPQYLQIATVPELRGRAPRYVERTNELFFCAPKDVREGVPASWKNADLWVVKNFESKITGRPISLFNGQELTGWKGGPTWVAGRAQLDGADTGEGALINTTKGPNLQTVAEFGDCTVELEFMLPKGSNSGIYLMGEYEIQLLDGTAPAGTGAHGALYGVAAPRVISTRPPGQWQKIVIDFHAPRFDGDKKTANARLIKVVLNDLVIHEDVEIKGVTDAGLTGKEHPTGPLMFQGVLGAVALRNIKITPTAVTVGAPGGSAPIVLQHPNVVRRLDFSPDGKTLVTACYDGKARCWSLATGATELEIAAESPRCKSAVYSPNGTLVLTTGDSLLPKLLEVGTGKKLFDLQGHTQKLDNGVFAPDGTVATGGWDQTIKLWDPATGKERKTLTGCEGYVVGLAFSADGKTLISASAEGKLRLWDVGTGQVKATLQAHAATFDVALSRDGKILATADSRDPLVKLWAYPSLAPLATLTGHTARVNGVAFSPDGKLLASGSSDGTVRLWDVQPQKELAVLKDHAAEVWCVTFSKDGKTLASASADQTVRLWEVAKVLQSPR